MTVPSMLRDMGRGPTRVGGRRKGADGATAPAGAASVGALEIERPEGVQLLTTPDRYFGNSAGRCGGVVRIHLHHRRRSIHVSPASETRASKRLTSDPQPPVRRDPHDEGVDQPPAAGGGRLLRHPADGLLGAPKPHLVVVAVWIELSPKPEGLPVGFPGRLRAASGSAGRRASRAGPAMTIASSPAVMP